MAEHEKPSPDSSPPRAPSLDKSRTASRKVTPTETEAPLPLSARLTAKTFYKTVPLSWDEYKSAREVIEDTFRRVDYDPFKGEIMVRMNSPIHDSFALSFNTAILDKLRPLEKGDTATAKFVADIRPMGSSCVSLNNTRRSTDPGDDVDKKVHKGPDLQYCNLNSKYPGIVVEVAYTQQAKKLNKIAKDYIRGSRGKIKAKPRLTPKPNGPGSILEVEQVIKAVAFRDAHQQPLNSDHELVLTLHDLAAKEDLLANVEDLPIAIRYDKLCGFVNEMENFVKKKAQHAEESEDDSIEVRLSSSSEIEQLSTDDEHEEAQKKITENDASFSRHVGKDIKGRPNVSTRSASKRRAPTITGENLPVTKRRPGSKRRRQ
ncbi:hypothetical protein FoTM2_015565 [Fusarium oxysporum f. sp. vasinfectum]|nr:hypothetical protein FoTM2_015565 [Fusarium oxysporum f. sp. vasinfectum]